MITAHGLDARIDVWHLRLTDEDADEAFLDATERARIERFRLESKRTQFRAARSQMRRILGAYLGIAPESVHFEYGEHGKPFVPDHRELEFNLSHSGDQGLLGVTTGTPLGIDIERHKPDRRFIGIASRFFADDEHTALVQLDGERQAGAFYRAWACKEAYLKAWGTGLSFPSSGFSIEYLSEQSPRLLATTMPGDDPAAWQLADVHTVDGFAGAICYRGGKRWLRHFTRGFVSREPTTG